MILRRIRSIGRGGLAAASSALVLAAPAAAQAPDPPAPDFVLSTPGKVSRWAPVERRAVARVEPQAGARRVATLGRFTPEGTANLVLALARREVGGKLWLKVRLPILPNGSTGWVRREQLGEYTAVRTHLIIDRKRFRARLVRSGKTVFRARIGVGLGRWPTPAGEFYVRSRLTGFGSSPVYGPLAFGLSARSAVLTDWPGGGFIGVHGTNQPGLLPGRVSHGCIRLRNADILRLGRRMPVGTPVTIK